MAGTASAVLLASLEWVTTWREHHLWIIALLPLAGFLIGWIYHRHGKRVEAGNNLILEEVHDPQATIPVRMTPLVLLGTVATHLFGGSAGREGTALQTGASLADQLTRPLGMGSADRSILLTTGLAAGFGSVFGTPLAGAVFGLEVLAIGKLRYDALFPCFIAAAIGDEVTRAWGIHHPGFVVPFVPAVRPIPLLACIVAGALFGLVGRLFAQTTHAISHFLKRHIAYPPLRPVVGGLAVATAVWVLGTTRYIGLGVPTIIASFSQTLPPWDFAAKLIFTAVTLGAGFKGGEVTPLFFIGSTMGNALARILPLPSPLLAGMGFVAVFAGAANTPLASTLMAIELFGSPVAMFAGIACVVSYLFSGHAGIYQAQRIALSKQPAREHESGLTLAAAQQMRRLPDLNLHDDLDPFGFPKGSESLFMQDLTIARLYFHHGATMHADSRWRRLMRRSLGVHLLTKAKDAGIRQAILHRVSGGYLEGDRLCLDQSEVPPAKLPQCLELIDQEDMLRRFLELHAPHLAAVRIVLLRGETLDDPLVEEVGA